MSQSIHIHEDTNREVIWKCIISYKNHQLGCHHPVDTLCLQGIVRNKQRTEGGPWDKRWVDVSLNSQKFLRRRCNVASFSDARSKGLSYAPDPKIPMVQREFMTLGIYANTNTSVRQRKKPRQTPVFIPPLKQTNKNIKRLDTIVN